MAGKNDSPCDRARTRLSPNIVALGFVSMLTAMSSAMIYGLLPVYLVRVLGATMASVGLIEGIAEASTSLIKVFSGAASDWIGRRKPLVVAGYTLSALVKTLFPLATVTSTILAARVVDRLGKGIRDAPRDAFLADITAVEVRGTGFGLRLSLAIAGFVFGPLLAVLVMRWSNDDFRLVFWIALIPAYFSIAVLLLAVTELPANHVSEQQSGCFRRRELIALPPAFWWAITIAGLLSLARFSSAFLVLKSHEAGVDAAYVPLMLALMYLVYSATAYPFGMLSDHIHRPFQLGIGTAILLTADTVLLFADTVWLTAIGVALWGLQLGATQGLLGAMVADAAPERLRGTAFGIYDVAIGVATFAASAGAGTLWMVGGAAATFGISACVALTAALALALRTLSKADANT